MVSKTFPVPPGFVWHHDVDTYVHPDGRTWDSDTNEFRDKGGNVLKTTIDLPVSPEQVRGESVEQEIVRKGLTAARIRPEDVEAAIVGEEFLRAGGGTLMVCVLTLRNGFQVTGESACASPENFDEGVGRRVSRDKAKEKIWPLLGYNLRQQLHEPYQGRPGAL